MQGNLKALKHVLKVKLLPPHVKNITKTTLLASFNNCRKRLVKITLSIQVLETLKACKIESMDNGIHVRK